MATSPKSAQCSARNATRLGNGWPRTAASIDGIRLEIDGITLAGSALAGLEAPLRLIDHVNAAFAAHQTVIPMAAAKRFQ
jgi:hypothetical protein